MLTEKPLARSCCFLCLLTFDNIGVGPIGSVQVRIHPPRLELHPCHVELLVGKLRVRVLAVHRIDSTIDLLADGPR
jgi:hypothetical protein